MPSNLSHSWLRERKALPKETKGIDRETDGPRSGLTILGSHWHAADKFQIVSATRLCQVVAAAQHMDSRLKKKDMQFAVKNSVWGRNRNYEVTAVDLPRCRPRVAHL